MHTQSAHVRVLFQQFVVADAEDFADGAQLRDANMLVAALDLD